MGPTDVLPSADEPRLSTHVDRWRTRSTIEQSVFHSHGGLFLQRSPWVGRWAVNSAPLGKPRWLESLSRGHPCGEQAGNLGPFIHPTQSEESSTLGFNTRWQPSTHPTFHRRATHLTWRKVPLQKGCARVCVCVFNDLHASFDSFSFNHHDLCPSHFSRFYATDQGFSGTL